MGVLKKYITLGLGLIGLGIAVSRCVPEREFKGYGVITSAHPSAVEIKALTPNPLVKEVRPCQVMEVKEGSTITCTEQVGELAYTHTFPPEELRTPTPNKGVERGTGGKEVPPVGTFVQARLPVLETRYLRVSRQYVTTNPLTEEEGTLVFLVGKYRGKEPLISKVYGVEESGKAKVGVGRDLVKVCVPPKYYETQGLTFLFYQVVGSQVRVYELMHPNVVVDKTMSGTVLADPRHNTTLKVLIMDSQLQQVVGFQELDTLSSLSACYNNTALGVPVKGLVEEYPLGVTRVTKGSRPKPSLDAMSVVRVLLMALSVVIPVGGLILLDG